MAMYRLHKSRTILLSCYKAFKRRRARIDVGVAKEFKNYAMELQDSILSNDREKADHYAKILLAFSKEHLKRNPFDRFFESTFAIVGALLIAIVVRQTTFEPYEIPSGSMRPTYKEQDRLIVSKTQFGLNVPLTTKHLFFKPEEIKRMGVVVFTGEGMDIHNVKTRYFFLFPGYRQYIKRMIGLPKDTLYFYGGKIYGVDKDGNDITDKLQLDELTNLEHIPYMQLEGKTIAPKVPVNDIYSPIVMHQMNIPIVKLNLTSKKSIEADFLLKPKTTDTSELAKFDVYKLWGMENFANARILRKSIVSKRAQPEGQSEDQDYFLELTHHQSAIHPTLNRDAYYRTRPSLTVEKSYIPLNTEALERIWNHMYTGRFIVDNGYIRRYGVSAQEAANNSFLPKLKGGIPNGTYEFQDGKLYQILSQGRSKLIDDSHLLAQFSPMRLYILFNAGIECDIRFLPIYHDQTILPSRYAYFRDGDLYLMGAKIFDRDSEELASYNQTEVYKKEKISDYIPFVDQGPPLLADGSLDIEKVKMYGITVPEHHYLVLGDNHAMSGDSRDFGFVPEANIRGIPSFLFWAPGHRFGFPNGDIYPFFTLPKMLIWGSILIAYAIYTFIRVRFFTLPINFSEIDA